MKNNIIFLLAFIFACAFPLTKVQASEEKELEVLKAGAASLVQQALSNGHVEIAGVPLVDLLSRIDKVHLAYMGNETELEGTRKDGYYFSGFDGSVAKLNKQSLQEKDSNRQALLVLHELTGASGYYDRNYALSLKIFYSGKKAQNNITEIIVDQNVLKKGVGKTNQSTSGGGGGTSVGGGGDSDAIEAKILVLDKLSALKSSGENFYQGVSLSRLAQVTLDCNYEFYEGQHAVSSKAFMKEYYKRNPSSGRIDVASAPWIVLQIRRDWLQQTSSEQSSELILRGLTAVLQKVPDSLALCDSSSLSGYAPLGW